MLNLRHMQLNEAGQHFGLQVIPVVEGGDVETESYDAEGRPDD